ncbi:hypothetical protein OE88DRAFT_1651735 [Heliocybe sulcata]|uniref:Uncharacterized protein n=1 Tax=Heliocybe sulcata TaxID=5364 RepID=A0A5C3NDI8_9AGAM|nr:hypothetical protein OE88DRAFT_1651735 [Heliocybe sulcata]
MDHHDPFSHVFEFDPSVPSTSTNTQRSVPPSPQPQSLPPLPLQPADHRSPYQSPRLDYSRPQTSAIPRESTYTYFSAPPVPCAPPYPAHAFAWSPSDAQTHPLDMHRITSQDTGLSMSRGWMPEQISSGSQTSMLPNANMTMGNGVYYSSYPHGLPGDGSVQARNELGRTYGHMSQADYSAMEQYAGLNAGYSYHGWQ